MKTIRLTLDSQIDFITDYIDFLEESKKAARKRTRKSAYARAIEQYKEILRSLKELKKCKENE